MLVEVVGAVVVIVGVAMVATLHTVTVLVRLYSAFNTIFELCTFAVVLWIVDTQVAFLAVAGAATVLTCAFLALGISVINAIRPTVA